MSDVEYVYILTNPAMPEWVKVGKTNNIKNRLRSLNEKTAVPLPFECYAYMEVPSDKVFAAEKSLHHFLGNAVDKEKEFFKSTPENVLREFEQLALNNDDYKIVLENCPQNSINVQKAKNTTFEMLGIKPGTTLYKIGDSDFTVVTKNSKNKVLYEGKEYSISGLATEKLGYKSINGFTLFSLTPPPNQTSLFDLRK